MNDDADRFERIERRLAEQERAIGDLDAAATAQWATLESLRRHIEQIVDRLADAEDRLPGTTDRPPPHY